MIQLVLTDVNLRTVTSGIAFHCEDIKCESCMRWDRTREWDVSIDTRRNIDVLRGYLQLRLSDTICLNPSTSHPSDNMLT
jgi:hypothetical protein